jgi:hypothetical protein
MRYQTALHPDAVREVLKSSIESEKRVLDILV